MKLLLCSMTVVLLLSVSVFAEKEFVGEAVNDQRLDTTGIRGARMCTMDLNQWGHSSRCDCGEGQVYNPKNGRCGTRVLRVGKPLPLPDVSDDKPRFVRCTKDRNRWGHSSVCHCSLPGYEYDQRVGRCLFVPEADEPTEEDADIADSEVIEDSESTVEGGEGAGGAGIIAGCEGGEMSPDGLVISCPDGSVFHRSRSSAEDLSRSLAEHVEERYEETETSYPQPFAGVR